MKSLYLIFAMALAGCSKPAEAPPPEPTSPVATAPAIDSWPGKYEGDLIVKIDGTPQSGHRLMLIEAAPDGCTGDIGVADGGLMSNRVSDTELHLILHPAQDLTCTIAVRKAADTLTISETGDCTAYHGATCSFNGTATRIRP